MLCTDFVIVYNPRTFQGLQVYGTGKTLTWDEFWASGKWKEPAFLLILVDTLIFPLVDIVVTAFDLNLIQVKKQFYLYVHLAIGLITSGIIEERKHRYKKNYPKI